jgi:hypothetical protein
MAGVQASDQGPERAGNSKIACTAELYSSAYGLLPPE